MMTTSAQASNSSANSRLAAASVAKNVGPFRNALQVSANSSDSTSLNCNQLLNSASITTLCASTCARKRSSSFPIASLLILNLPHFIVHGATALPIAKPEICLEAQFTQLLERFL